MKIIIENKIPYIKGVLDNIAEVVYLSPDDFNPENIADADAMVIRTRTKCDAHLLDNSKCKFIATATIGTDHINLDYCREKGISVHNAPGCNAPAVAQYVFASIGAYFRTKQTAKLMSDMTLGVIGVGNVGKIVVNWGKQLGMTVLQNDPPRASIENTNNFVSLEEIAQKADIITFHTPLSYSGEYATHHLCNDRFLSSLQKKPLIINCARGAIMDTSAVIDAINSQKISDTIIDCWENEPHLNLQLLNKSFIATPHIAGYSIEGKIRATIMSLKALCLHFNLPDVTINAFDNIPMSTPQMITMQAIMNSYNPMIDSSNLKSSPETFELLRNNYSLRHELSL